MLQNKNGIIFGVANKRSIAWATAQALHESGAKLAFTYQGDRLKENVEGLTADTMPGSLLLSCDVTKQDEVDETFRKVGEEFGRLDFLIHSIAFALVTTTSARRSAANDRRRQHRHDVLLRRGESCRRLQRDGCR
jgi:enoyl-[acyl-carrier protein] reductase I